jgi:hypothetical protein
MQHVLQRRIAYVSTSALARRCRVTPPPCIKKQYLNTDPIIDAVYDTRGNAYQVSVMHFVLSKHVHFPNYAYVC